MAKRPTITIGELIDSREWKRGTVKEIFPDDAVGPNGGLRRKVEVSLALVRRKENTKRFANLQDKYTYVSLAGLLKERGWTATLVDRLLGDPDRTAENPHYKKAAPMKLYSLARVKKAENRAIFQETKAKKMARQAKAEARAKAAAEAEAAAKAREKAQQEREAQGRVDALLARMSERWGDTRFSSMFPVARRQHRKLRLFVGPTNSGKTHAALELLRESTSGIYLAPLRLLALEGQARIEAMGIPCSMITGEEQCVREDARVVSSTIEMMDERTPVDVAIIDEIQMLSDPERGWAWVNALIGAPGREVVMTGSADVIPVVETLADYLGEPLEIRRFERHTPLVVDDAPTPLAELAPHTALIAFSRREILDLKSYLEHWGRSVAVIYGALGPEVRSEEARRFREGEADILVASDAIAYGLNLPVRHIVFWSASKWDGRSEKRLSPALIQQIAGRAGRYGLHDSGFVGAVGKNDLAWIRQAMSTDLPAQRPPVTVFPSLTQLQMLQEVMQTDRLERLIRFYVRRVRLQDDLFVPGRVEDIITLAKRADAYRKRLSVETRYILSLAPVNLRSPQVLGRWESFANAVANKKTVSPPGIGKNYKKGLAKDTQTLQVAEDAVQIQNLYRWLAYRFPDIFVDPTESARRTKILNAYIVRSLNHVDLARRCTSCGVSLPIHHRHAQCDECFHLEREYW